MVGFLLALLGATAILAIVLAVALARRPRVAAPAPPPADEAPAPAPAVAGGASPDPAFERFPLAALRADGETRLLAANARARADFPFLKPGRLLLECFGEHRLAELAARALESGRPVEGEVRLFTDDRHTYRVVADPLTAGAGRECLLFLTDLTEAIAYQELRSQFSANVSHELRTPLTGLRGLLEALADEEIPPELRARFTARAIAETGRLEALITDVLFLSELEASPGTGSERTDLCDAVRGSVEALGSLADAEGAAIDVRSPGRLVVPLTERMARTVVQNLLENAIKYAGPAAQVTVEARPDASGAMAVLIVADNGPGIAERHLPHIFERFYRADASRSKRLGGTGLGLSLVKHIAERAGGRAEARSREGFGTTMTVTIPMASDFAGTEPQHRATGGNRAAPADLPTG